jgi:hypothetical protein
MIRPMIWLPSVAIQLGPTSLRPRKAPRESVSIVWALKIPSVSSSRPLAGVYLHTLPKPLKDVGGGRSVARSGHEHNAHHSQEPSACIDQEAIPSVCSGASKMGWREEIFPASHHESASRDFLIFGAIQVQ